MNIYKAVTDAGLRPAHDFFQHDFFDRGTTEHCTCGPG